MIDPPKVIGPRLKDLRRALEVGTQVEFARAIGVEKNTYNPWEKGSRPLTFEGACLIRKKYDIPLPFGPFSGKTLNDIPLDYLFFGRMDGLPDWVRVRLLKQVAA